MKKTVSIIGGGPAAMFLAAHLDPDQFSVTIFEKNKALGRKFLVAGKGGFNLSHSESLAQFISRYTPFKFLENAIAHFSNEDLRIWLNTLKIPTFIGSSKRIYPEKGIKPIAVFNAILAELKEKNVDIKTEQNWRGWNAKNELLFESGLTINSDLTIFCLGGKSWKKTGSSGEWANYFSEKKINIVPFEASNCAYKIDWKSDFLTKNEGKAIKNIAISCKKSQKKGEVVITKFGLEGGVVYALSPEIREQLHENKIAKITIDLKPGLSCEAISSKLHPEKITQQLSKSIKLEKPKIDLLKTYLSKEAFLDLNSLSKTIKNFPLEITDTATIDEAISTVGGIELDEIDANFEFKKLPNNYSIGEMLDYDAPTGGYLLQSCFSMGIFLAQHLNKKQ